MLRCSWIDSLTERIAVALVLAVAAVVTLALYPLALVILGRGTGGGSEFELGAYFYAFVFSKAGLALVIGASFVGFCTGAKRMTEMFSFFWGTHSFWANLRTYLDDKFDDLQAEHNVPHWLLIILVVVLALVILKLYAQL